jgi:hypothetical protein
VPPFTTDAIGPIVDPMGAQMHVADALRLQARTGVRVSGLFNNINVPPTRTLAHSKRAFEPAAPLPQRRGCRTCEQEVQNVLVCSTARPAWQQNRAKTLSESSSSFRQLAKRQWTHEASAPPLSQQIA